MNTRSATLAAALALLAAAGASADGGARMPAQVPKAYTAECGACHTAYPPALLPRESWRRIMTGLDRHYGSDASLDAGTVRQLDAWLQATAGTSKKAREAPPEDRITRAAWFLREHRKVDAATWALPSVKSPAQCAACHAGADQGRFDDDDLRIPEGLSAAQRRAWRD